MAHNLTEADVFTTPISVPDGTDTHNTAANVVDAIAQALANRTKHLNDHAAFKDVANTFTAPQTIPNIAGSLAIEVDLAVGGAIGAIGDVYAGDDVIAHDEFQYESPVPIRTKYLPLFRSFGVCTFDFVGSTGKVQFSAGGQVQIWPIELPKGATLASVQAIIDKAGTGSASLSVYRKQGYDWSTVPAVLPNDFQIGSTAAALGTGAHTLTVGSLTQIVDNNLIDLYAVVSSADADSVYGLRVTFTDPGPRNH
jgi:hypothetical protein